MTSKHPWRRTYTYCTLNVTCVLPLTSQTSGTVYGIAGKYRPVASDALQGVLKTAATDASRELTVVAYLLDNIALVNLVRNLSLHAVTWAKWTCTYICIVQCSVL